jgi:PAS domain S-box-containing protein
MLDEYRDHYHNSLAGYHCVDANGVFTRMNNTELWWLGYCNVEVNGKLYRSDILNAKSAEWLHHNLQKLRGTGRVNEVEYDFVRKDGTTFRGLLHSKTKLDIVGHFVGSSATVIEISQRRCVEKNLRLSEANFIGAQTLAQYGNYQFYTAPGVTFFCSIGHRSCIEFSVGIQKRALSGSKRSCARSCIRKINIGCPGRLLTHCVTTQRSN